MEFVLFILASYSFEPKPNLSSEQEVKNDEQRVSGDEIRSRNNDRGIQYMHLELRSLERIQYLNQQPKENHQREREEGFSRAKNV